MGEIIETKDSHVTFLSPNLALEKEANLFLQCITFYSLKAYLGDVSSQMF